MAGLFPGICNCQNVDRNGVPLAGSVLSVYQGGTLTLASCFQDIGLAIPAQNPMTADETGRLPIFYVADGVYRVRLIDVTGVSIFDYPQVASIGASSSGGGGSAVDPTTVFQTGDGMWLDVDGVRTGWVRDNGRTIGSATSGASERANTDCQALFLVGWARGFASGWLNGWSVVGGAGASAAADWAANKQLTLPDRRGFGAFGLDTMGAAAAGRFAGVTFTFGDGATAGAYGGAPTHAIVRANLPVVTLDVTIPAGQGEHDHEQNDKTGYDNGLGAGGGGGIRSITLNAALRTDLNTLPAMFGTAPLGGLGTALETIPSFVLGTFYRKL